MAVRGVGHDGQPGKADDVDSLKPGEVGQGQFLIRGEKEGFATIDFDINAVLEGLLIGPVNVSGRASRGVLVPNPFFDMTFTLPSVLRRGPSFNIFNPMTNIPPVL